MESATHLFGVPSPELPTAAPSTAQADEALIGTYLTDGRLRRCGDFGQTDANTKIPERPSKCIKHRYFFAVFCHHD